jgi:hypothetical protein
MGSAVPYKPLPWEASELVFVVREPFPSRTSQATLVYGRIDEKRLLSVRSRMPESGVIFSDGMEADCLRFTAGIEATVRPSATAGRLIC